MVTRLFLTQPPKPTTLAKLSADGSELKPVGPPVGKADPSKLGLTKHQRISKKPVRNQVRERFKRWDEEMRITERWTAQKAAFAQMERRRRPRPGTVHNPCHRVFPTTETARWRLTLLVDFSDDPRHDPRRRA